MNSEPKTQDEHNTTSRGEYAPPRLTYLGSVSQLTESGASGNSDSAGFVPPS